MTNEQYLYVSYFAAATVGVAGAIIMAVILSRPHREATSGATPPFGCLLRRAFPSWLILAVLLGFMSVTYVDYNHSDYAAVVADRDHLYEKTREQTAAMALYLAGMLVVYGFVLMFFLWARARRMRGEPSCGQRGPAGQLATGSGSVRSARRSVENAGAI